MRLHLHRWKTHTVVLGRWPVEYGTTELRCASCGTRKPVRAPARRMA